MTRSIVADAKTVGAFLAAPFLAVAHWFDELGAAWDEVEAQMRADLAKSGPKPAAPETPAADPALTLRIPPPP